MHAAGNANRDVGRFREAEPFFRRCFEIRQKIFPKDSAPVIQGLYNLGRVLSDLGRNQEAEERFKSVLEMYLSIVA